jgi:hypothetical protein
VTFGGSHHGLKESAPCFSLSLPMLPTSSPGGILLTPSSSSSSARRSETKRWESNALPSMSQSRYGGAASIHLPPTLSSDGSTNNERVIIIGGLNNEQYLSSCEMLDCKLMKWSKLTNMNDNRQGFAATCIKNRYIYVFGGADLANGDHLSAEMYDVELDVWKPIQVAPT